MVEIILRIEAEGYKTLNSFVISVRSTILRSSQPKSPLIYTYWIIRTKTEQTYELHYIRYRVMFCSVHFYYTYISYHIKRYIIIIIIIIIIYLFYSFRN